MYGAFHAVNLFMKSLVARLDFLQKLYRGIASRVQFFKIIRTHNDFGGYVQPNHGDLPGSRKNDFGGMGIVIDIGFSDG